MRWLLRTLEANKHLGTSWPLALKQHFKYLEREKNCKYFHISKVHFHNEQGLALKRYLQVFFSTIKSFCMLNFKVVWHPVQFFFAKIYPIFGKYVMGIFSFNIWTVFYQSELQFSDFDQKCAKTRPWLLKILELPIDFYRLAHSALTEWKSESATYGATYLLTSDMGRC